MDHVNSFLGMDSDSAPEMVKQTNYLYGENFKIISDENNNSLIVDFGKGPKPIAYSNHKIVSINTVEEFIIIFIDEGPTQRIYRTNLIFINSINSPVLIGDPSYFTEILSASKLDLGDSISVVSSIENADTYNVYFVSNTVESPIRRINIKNIYGYVSNLSSINLFKNTILNSPKYSITSGSLKCGMYMYVYCLFKKNESETSYSSPTKPIYLTSDSLDSTSTSFLGNASEENSGKGVSISIEGCASDDYIRLIRMYFPDIINLPICTIVYEGRVLLDNDYRFKYTDTGTSILGTLSLEEVSAPFVKLTSKYITSKNNMLVLANVNEYNFDVDINTKVYRFNKFGQAILYKGDSIFYSGYGPISSIPNDDDAYNSYSNPRLDFTYLPDYRCRFKSDGVTLGGEGPVISYEFITTSYKYTDVVPDNSYTIGSPYFYKLLDIKDHIPPNAEVGYLRDEVYRFGIVFYNSEGQRTPVKWIDDVRFPDYFSHPLHPTNDRYWVLGIKFTIDTSKLPSEVVAYQIVRAVRSLEDSTIIDCGLMSRFTNFGQQGKFYIGNFSAYLGNTTHNWEALSLNMATAASTLWFDFISPEVAYFKNYRVKPDVVSMYPTSKIYKNVSLGDYYYQGAESLWSSPVAVTVRQKQMGSIFKDVYDIADSYFFNYIDSSEDFITLPVDGITMGVNTAPTKTDTNYRRGRRYSSMMLKLGRVFDTIFWTQNNIHRSPAYTVRKKLIYPYGGSTSVSKENTKYIPCSPVIPRSNSVVEVYNGDTFIGVFEYMLSIHSNKIHSKCIQPVCVQVPIESRINLWYKGSPGVSFYDPNYVRNFPGDEVYAFNSKTNEHKHWVLHEKSGIYPVNSNETMYFTQSNDLYSYNSAYSNTNPSIYLYPKLSLQSSVSGFDTRVLVSDKKYNNALSDVWSKVRMINYIDLDATYGTINAISDIRPGVIVFQKKGISIIPIEERVLMPDVNRGSIVAGKSGVIDRYDYITKSYGVIKPSHICSTPYGVFFMDVDERVFGKVSDSLEILSITKKIQSLLNKEHYFGYYNSSVVFDDELSEVIFSTGSKSYLYSPNLDVFVSVLDSTYENATSLSNETLAYTNKEGNNHSVIFRLNRGDYGRYKTLINVNSYNQRSRFLLRFSVSPNNGVINRLDQILINGTSSDNSSNTELLLNKIRVYNNYQDTGILNVYPNLLTHRYRTWRINLLRDYETKKFMIDYYHIVELVLDDLDSTNRIKLKSVYTTYKPIFNR